jgi:hypothetical protein
MAYDLLRGPQSYPFLRKFVTSSRPLLTKSLFSPRIMTSDVIKITYKYCGCCASIKIPEALICEISSVIKKLCEHHEKRTFTIEEILGKSQQSFTEKMLMEDTFEQMLELLVEWVYTGGSNADTFDDYLHDLWYLGQRIGAPSLQNSVLRTLCSQEKRNSTSTFDILGEILGDGDLSNWEDQEDIEASEEKLLMFLLDCMVWAGPAPVDVRDMLLAGGIITIMYAHGLHATGNRAKPPWHPDNLEQYMLPEGPTGVAS